MHVCMCVDFFRYFIFIISSYGAQERRLFINDCSVVVVIRFVVVIVASCTRLLFPGRALLLLLHAAVPCT